MGDRQKVSIPLFLVLVPKIVGSCMLSEFRSISLVNPIYKLIDKVLSSRLSVVISSIIADNQQSFIQGRSILDFFMMATDLLHIIKRRRERAFIIKIDFQKAFDSLSWDFLESIMRGMGYNKIWILIGCMNTILQLMF